MIININTNSSNIFKQWLTIMNTILSKDKKLIPSELEVLAKILYIDYLYKHLTKEQRDKLLFHKETKLKIRESLLNMSDNSFKNILSKLNKKGFIDYHSLKVKVPLVDNIIDIQFKLKLED